MNNLPERKVLRLKNYDYSKTGHYFITVCVDRRHTILGEIVGDGLLDVPNCNLSDIGKIVVSQMQLMNDLYEDRTVVKYVIMPNHVHMIVAVTEKTGTSGRPSPTSAVNAIIPTFVGTFKRFTHKKSGLNFWQSSYYDHVIRDEKDYLRIWQYIDENPQTWQKDLYFQYDP